MAKEQRLIDAKTAVLALTGMEIDLTDERIKFIIDNIPTVDAVEVVRCEDCLYRSQYPDESGHYKCGGLLTEDEELLLMVKPDFFCAYGEKRCKDAVD